MKKGVFMSTFRTKLLKILQASFFVTVLALFANVSQAYVSFGVYGGGYNYGYYPAYYGGGYGYSPYYDYYPTSYYSNSYYYPAYGYNVGWGGHHRHHHHHNW